MSIDLKQSSYIRLRSIIKERTNSVVFWVGSGLSAIDNLPTWNTLKDKLIIELEKKLESIDSENIKKKISEKESIKQEKNNWVAFHRLKNALGPTSYNSVIKEQLSIKKGNSTLYEKLWSLGIAGMINSNIDKLALLGHNNVSKKTLIQFTGKYVKNFMHVLNNPNRYLLNIHGDIEDVSSWVFTVSELKSLMKSVAYKQFINTTILSKTVVFIGISADDESAGGHIEKLIKSGCSLSSHFWITDRCDEKTDKWAEESGIQLIKYKNTKNHSEINTILEDFIDFVPVDETAPPVIHDRGETRDLPPLEELLKEDAEMIRLFLNDEASRIFNSKISDPYGQFIDFVNNYDEAIHRAWYTTTTPPNNVLFGYKLNEIVHKGMFGIVYKAKNSNDETFAIKLLKNDVRKEDQYIQGFRRGIKSMKILETHDIKGMAKIIDASEIPAFLIMDWIEGVNLNHVVKEKLLSSTNDYLKLFHRLAFIINSAHRLPERVLHRDIRPSNIMINWDNNLLNLESIIVLDFDLAWYKASIESVEMLFSISNGYLAPEQISPELCIKARNAAVDSFGLGMTFFYMISGNDPIPFQHRHQNWEEDLFNYSYKAFRDSKWKSLPLRIARLIINCTKDTQSERWDLSQILYELNRLIIANETPSKILSCDLIVEELLFRSRYNRCYKWNEDKLIGTIDLPDNKVINVISDDSNRIIKISIIWGISSHSKQKHKKVEIQIQQLKEKFLSYNYRISHFSYKSNRLCIEAIIHSSAITADLDEHAKLLSSIELH